MAYFLVGIRGDAHRAAGLLANAGIQNVVAQPRGDTDVPGRTLIARLSAENAERAVQRVSAALEGEPFTVEDDAREE